jgi:MFS family permease
LSTPERRLWFFVAGQSLSVMGDAFSALALPLLLLDAGANLTTVTSVQSAGMAVTLAVMLFSGALVDNSDRRRLLLGSDLVQGSMLLLIPLLSAFGALALPIVIGAKLVGSAAAALYAVGHGPFMAELSPPDQRLRANGAINLGGGIAMAVGPWLAGLACERFGPANAFGLDALSFYLSAIFLVLIGPVLLQSAPAAAPRPGNTVQDSLRGVVEGYRWLRANEVLRWFFALACAENFVAMVSVNLFIVYLSKDLAASDSVVGLVLSAAAVGGIIGAIAAPVVGRWLGAHRALPLTGLLMGLSLCGALFARTVDTVVIAAALFLIGRIMSMTLAMALRQAVVPGEQLGRVGAVLNVILTTCGLLGAAIAGPLGGAIGIPGTFAAFGALVVVTALWTLSRPPAIVRTALA